MQKKLVAQQSAVRQLRVFFIGLVFSFVLFISFPFLVSRRFPTFLRVVRVRSFPLITVYRDLVDARQFHGGGEVFRDGDVPDGLVAFAFPFAGYLTVSCSFLLFCFRNIFSRPAAPQLVQPVIAAKAAQCLFH
jgi:hypothetical protein